MYLKGFERSFFGSCLWGETERSAGPGREGLYNVAGKFAKVPKDANGWLSDGRRDTERQRAESGSVCRYGKVGRQSAGIRGE